MTRLLFILFALLISTPSFAQANEGAGLIYSDLNGALPKGLWRKQNRSEIIYLLQNLPAHSSSRAVQEIKRDMLLSYYDTSEIVNDVSVKSGKDLLTLRLQKLMEMGLWEDALKLYTNTTEDPGQNNKLGQIGLLLILNQRGLSTACLEEKVLYGRFADTVFWKQIDRICNIEMGISTKETVNDFPDSSVLQAIFFDKDFKISAQDIETLEDLSPLELSLLALKNRIKYDRVNLSKVTAPFLIKTFMEDKKFPSQYKGALENQAQRLALSPIVPLSEEQNKRLETPNILTQPQILSIIATKIRLGQKISKESADRMAKLAKKNPENYYFLKILESTNKNYGNNITTEDNFNLGQEVLRKKHPQELILLQSALDKSREFSNNLDTVYEKQVNLTPNDGYVMSMGSSKKWLEETQRHHLAGLSLLIILSTVENVAKDDVIKSLSTVGLINQAHHIANEELAKLMDI
jgi:hypothetical protein